MWHWLNVPLDLDEATLAERWEGEVLFDRAEIQLLARKNSMSLWRSDPFRYPLTNGTVGLDLTLKCAAHAHPECRFRWVRLTVGFESADRVQVQDMSPRDEVVRNPVRLTADIAADHQSYDIVSSSLPDDVARKRSQENDIYFPTITTSGPRFQHATWTFVAVNDAPLHIDRSLRLLLTAPDTIKTIPTKVSLHGKVAVAGWGGSLPLFGQRVKEFTTSIDFA